MNINRNSDKCNVFEFVSQIVQFILLWSCYFQPRWIVFKKCQNRKHSQKKKFRPSYAKYDIFLMKS